MVYLIIGIYIAFIILLPLTFRIMNYFGAKASFGGNVSKKEEAVFILVCSLIPCINIIITILTIVLSIHSIRANWKEKNAGKLEYRKNNRKQRREKLYDWILKLTKIDEVKEE